MDYSVYLEESLVGLKPKVLEFLTAMIKKAKEKKDYALAMKRKEMAELVGKDTRTVSRYLKDLEDKDIIETKGKKGRGGATVIMFNPDVIKFRTSDKALLTSSNPETIEEVLERKFPKKEPKPKKRNRRTKQQLIEDTILQNKVQEKYKKLNEKVERLGGTPNWEWFKETDDPVGNYRTYLLSRMYNRYAALFSDRHNAEVEVSKEGNKVPQITNGYDVLPLHFYGSPRWSQFEKLRKFIDDNNIYPDVYLSAQFSRSVFNSSRKRNKNILPYVNSLVSDASYEVYLQYCKYQAKYSGACASYQAVPAEFSHDFVISALIEAYESSEVGAGLLQLRPEVRDFLQCFGATEEEKALLGFYRITEENLRNEEVSLKTRDLIKKYLLFQSLILTGGSQRLSSRIILSMELTRAILFSIDRDIEDKKKARQVKSRALGKLVHPYLPVDEQEERGRQYLYELGVLNETPQVLKLIAERKNLHLPVLELNKAFKEYGVDKIPVDDYSVLDIKQVIEFMNTEVDMKDQEEYVEIDHEEITDRHEWVFVASQGKEDILADEFSNFLKSTES